MSGEYSPRDRTPGPRKARTTRARLKNRVARASVRHDAARHRGACIDVPAEAFNERECSVSAGL